ncbi:hypothetical protein G4B88_022416 [Cannabis sativa]|uniref:Chromatin structure-remodeling complex protein BSH n=1 Tax=Cannabis sativa TaxID=3483 RepID=A0A7J6HVR6_CANSA|nr:hypothetical protein G4B88_022416 [Cannabis sativa]
MKGQASGYWRSSAVKFRIPTAQNLVPIRLDIELDDGHKFKDTFTWNPSDPDSEIVVFAKRTVKDLKLPPAFVTHIASSIQSQLAEFRSFEGQDMYAGEKIVPIKLDLRVNNILIKDQFLWDMNNFESDPEEFAKTFCKDLGIQDPEVAVSSYSGLCTSEYLVSILSFYPKLKNVLFQPAIAFSIREQLYETAIQSVASARESRISKKGRRGTDHTPTRVSGVALDLVKLFGHKSSVVRKRKEWDIYEPIVDLLSNEEVDALEAREERNAR